MNPGGTVNKKGAAGQNSFFFAIKAAIMYSLPNYSNFAI